ncbi:MAG: carbohydrate ABC transporter permease [Roseiarcus sp.]
MLQKRPEAERRRRRSRAARIGRFAVHAVLMAGSLLMVMPMLWMVATSFKPPPEIALWPPNFLPKAPTFDNYTGAFQAAPFARFFVNSVGLSLVATASAALTSLVAGAVFAKYRFPGRTFLFFLILATAIVPLEAYMIPLYLQLVGLRFGQRLRGRAMRCCPYTFPMPVADNRYRLLTELRHSVSRRRSDSGRRGACACEPSRFAARMA